MARQKGAARKGFVVPARVAMALDRLTNQGFYRVHLWVYRKTNGRVGANYSGGRIVLLTTTGRRTGAERTSPLLSMPDGERYVLIASNAGRPNHPAWFLNLLANPDVRIQDGRDVVEMTAREATGAEREELWGRVTDMYSGYATYQQNISRLIPIVVCEPR